MQNQEEKIILMLGIPCDLLLLGIMDSQAKCWKESMFGGPSTRNTLYSWEKLFRGNITDLL